MAKSKKITPGPWSEEEIELLKRLFPSGREKEIVEQTGRTLAAVRQKAYRLGLKTREYHRWSASEIELLKKLYPNENTRSIADKLGRSLGAVTNKAFSFSLKNVGRPTPWSRQEENLLRKLYPDNTVLEIASQIGRSALAVEGRAHKLELRKAMRYPVWSKKELNLLKKLYPRRTAQDVAEQIGRPVQATRLRIVKLGLKKRFRYDESHRVVSGVKQKRCSRCRKWKDESEFCKYSSRKDGLQVWCRECLNKAVHKSYKRRLTVRNLRRWSKMKRCTKCKKSKDKSRFGKDKRLKDGLSYWCIKCEQEYQHEYYLRTSKATRRYFKYEDSHRVVGGVKQKLCRKCRKWKAESEFHANPISKDGLKARCKKCARFATS